MTAHAVQVAKCPRFPSVSSQGRACEDVQDPGNQSRADGENEDAVEGFLQPFDDGASSQEKEDDGRFDERQYRYVQEIESHEYLLQSVVVPRDCRRESYLVVLIVVGFRFARRDFVDVDSKVPHFDVCLFLSGAFSSRLTGYVRLNEGPIRAMESSKGIMISQSSGDIGQRRAQ